MSQYVMTVEWERGDQPFVDRRYSRAHRWHFDGGATVPASSSPHVVRIPYSEPANVDPEEAFVAALSSCHMLSFLDIAAQRGFVVDRYADQATGELAKDESSKLSMTRVILHPHVVFAASTAEVTDDAVRALHHEAHEVCYIANSVRTAVETEPTWEVTPAVLA